MSNNKYKIWFGNCNYEPEVVIVTAENADEAIILAKAKRIKSGKDYTLNAVKLMSSLHTLINNGG